MRKLFAALAVLVLLGGVATAQSVYPKVTAPAGTELVQLYNNTANNIFLTLNNLKTFVAGASAASTIGFYGAAAVAQPSGAAQTAITDGSGGTAAPTTGVSAVSARQTFLINVNLASLSTGAQTINIDPGFDGVIKAINFRNYVTSTGAGATNVLQAHVAGTPTTGGALTATLSATLSAGAQIAGSAITAANTFTSAQAIGFTAAGGTVFTAGNGTIELTVENKSTEAALATIVAQTNALRAALVSLGLIKGGS